MNRPANAEHLSNVAVITGDIVHSSALSAAALDGVMAELERVARSMADWPGMPDTRFERYRGDGWQLCLGAPRFTLRAVLLLRAGLCSAHDDVQTRMGAALGPATLAARLASSSGPAFETSGRALEALGAHALWGFGGGLADSARDALARGLFALGDELSRGWTRRQAQIFAGLAVPAAPTMTRLAESLAVSPQTVQTHFDRAGGHALLSAVDGFEAAVAPASVGETAEND